MCAFSGLDVEEHLKLIGYLLELILLMNDDNAAAGGGPVGWRLRKTGGRRCLAKLLTKAKQSIFCSRCHSTTKSR